MTESIPKSARSRKPDWLKRRLPAGEAFNQVRELIEAGQLHTVCQEAKCPNIWECYSHHTATFLIMGERCTRNCRFCSVAPGLPAPLDPQEPARVAEAAAGMAISYVVVTSVTRDDLPDGGAGHFAATIHAIRRRIPGAAIEVLVPDFQGERSALETVLRLTGCPQPQHQTVPRPRRCGRRPTTTVARVAAPRARIRPGIP
jgi:lipoic acid synthetase